MARLKLRQEAIDDLEDIWKYTFEKWSRNQANKYYESLRLACVEIAENPSIGKGYYSISSELRGYKINKHIIFYFEILTGQIEVVRILHESMDLENRLSNS